jgi:hypothetical protein
LKQLRRRLTSSFKPYFAPNRTFVDLPALINEMDPLRDFSEACRRELQTAHRR